MNKIGAILLGLGLLLALSLAAFISSLGMILPNAMDRAVGPPDHYNRPGYATSFLAEKFPTFRSDAADINADLAKIILPPGLQGDAGEKWNRLLLDGDGNPLSAFHPGETKNLDGTAWLLDSTFERLPNFAWVKDAQNFASWTLPAEVNSKWTKIVPRIYLLSRKPKQRSEAVHDLLRLGKILIGGESSRASQYAGLNMIRSATSFAAEHKIRLRYQVSPQFVRRYLRFLFISTAYISYGSERELAEKPWPVMASVPGSCGTLADIVDANIETYEVMEAIGRTRVPLWFSHFTKDIECDGAPSKIWLNRHRVRTLSTLEVAMIKVTDLLYPLNMTPWDGVAIAAEEFARPLPKKFAPYKPAEKSPKGKPEKKISH